MNVAYEYKQFFLPREEKDSSLKIRKNSANNWFLARLGISKAKIKKFWNCRFQKNCTFLDFNPSLLDNAPTIPSALSKRDSPLWNRWVWPHTLLRSMMIWCLWASHRGWWSFSSFFTLWVLLEVVVCVFQKYKLFAFFIQDYICIKVGIYFFLPHF